ncbi:MAG: hypothetical protein NUV91_07610 [Candidatus Omnitrophica bacterium]|nr:hypothetical protein [Candidatus Omnitrophota bacterium]
MSEFFDQEAKCYFVRSWPSEKVRLFSKSSDYAYYLRVLKKYKAEYKLKIFAFCLIPQGIYLILQPRGSKDLSDFLEKTMDAYYLRLVQDGQEVKFIRNIVKDTQDLVDWIKYLEFIPVKHELALSPLSYRWSSCSYRVLGDQGGLLDSRPLLTSRNPP